MNSNETYRKRLNGGQHGDVFTKPEVVGFMLNEVGYIPTSDLSSVSIMEPSCGEGEFLLEIVRRLKQSSVRFGFDCNEAYHNCVFASDIDAEKIAVCAKRITDEVPEIEHPEQKLYVEDYVLSVHPSVDIVVGNPPYVRYEEIPEEKLDAYKKFSTFYYRADLYVPFFEKSLTQLNPGGRHCFICANRWMKNRYGKMLRRLIADGYYLEKIINMEGANAFQEEVLAYPAITLITKDAQKDCLLYSEISDVATLQDLIYEKFDTPKGFDWSDVFNARNKDLTPIEMQNFKIGIGIATGADGIFMSRDFVGRIEEELLVPVINAKDLSGDKMVWRERYFLNPYDRNGKLIPLDLYPKAKNYLMGHKERLSARHKARKNPDRWYGTIDAFSPMLRNAPKILLPDISGNSYVFVDEGNYYPQHNIYYITGKDIRQLRILAAILMSDFVRQQLDCLTNRMNGGYARWQSQHLRKLRIPTIASIPTALADALLRCYDSHNLSGINYCVSRILYNERGNGTAIPQSPPTIGLAYVPT